MTTRRGQLGRWLIAMAAGIGIAWLVVAVWPSRPPVYEARARIEISRDRPLATLLPDQSILLRADGRADAEAQDALLSGRALAARAAARLRTSVDPFIAATTILPVPGSRLIDVLHVDAEPRRAAQGANGLADEYVAWLRRTRGEALAPLLTETEMQLAEQESTADTAERRLRQGRLDTAAARLARELALNRVRLLQYRHAEVRERRLRLDRLVRQLDEAVPNDLAALVTSAVIQTQQDRLARLRTDHFGLRARYGDEHPRVIAATAAVDAAERRLTALASAARTQLRAQAALTLTEEDAFASRLAVQIENAREAGVLIDVSALMRSANDARRQRGELIERRNALQRLLLSLPDDVRVVSAAEPPTAPRGRSPAPIAAVGAGLFAALLVLRATGR